MPAATIVPVPLDPLAIDLMRAAAAPSPADSGGLRAMMDELLLRADVGDTIIGPAIQESPSLAIAQQLDAMAWLSASQRNFTTSVGDLAHLVFVMPILVVQNSPLKHRRLDPHSLAGFAALEQTLKEHGRVRHEAVLWTLPALFRPNEILAFTPSLLRRMNHVAFKRIKAARQQGWAPFDLDDPCWGAPPLAADHEVSDEAAEGAVELRFLIGGVLDRRSDAEALWGRPDMSDEDEVEQWNDTVEMWKQDAWPCVEQAIGARVSTLFFPTLLNVARDEGLYAWHDFLFHGVVLNARDQNPDVGIYATVHEVHAINEALGPISRWQDVSAVAIELRRRDDDTLLDIFAWPHSGLGDDQEWVDAIVDTLERHHLLLDRAASKPQVPFDPLDDELDQPPR